MAPLGSLFRETERETDKKRASARWNSKQTAFDYMSPGAPLAPMCLLAWDRLGPVFTLMVNTCSPGLATIGGLATRSRARVGERERETE